MREFKFFHGIIGPRKFRTTWTPEIVQDIQAHHGIDVESELVSLLSEEIAREVDNDILRALTTYRNGVDTNYLNRWINMENRA
jgi:hypothetical protein